MPRKLVEKGARISESWHVSLFTRPPRQPLACALLRQETTIQAQVPTNAARARVLCSKMLFGLVCMQIFRKLAMSKAHSLWSDIPWAEAWRIRMLRSKDLLSENIRNDKLIGNYQAWKASWKLWIPKHRVGNDGYLTSWDWKWSEMVRLGHFLENPICEIISLTNIQIE